VGLNKVLDFNSWLANLPQKLYKDKRSSLLCLPTCDEVLKVISLTPGLDSRWQGNQSDSIIDI
jgi:hypothetical protein